MRTKHKAFSGGAVLLLLATGCAYGQAGPEPQATLGETVLGAYERTVSTQGVAASVEETVQSGTDPVVQASGSSVLWFSERAGEIQLTIGGTTDSINAVRIGDKFFQGPTPSALAKNELNLAEGQHPEKLPQIVSPGLDPFQLTTLLGAIRWPETIISIGPVVIADAAGQHTAYQMTIDTAKLANHEPPADMLWLLGMSHEPNGATVTLEVTIDHGQIHTLTGRLPVPSLSAGADPGKVAGQPPVSLPMLPTSTMIATEQFNYQQPVAKVTAPA